MQNKKIHGQSGFTLIEVLFAIALIGLILSGIYSFFFVSQRAFNTGSDRANVQHNLRLAAEIITQEIRYATFLERLDDFSSIPENPGEVAEGDYFLFLDESRGSLTLLNSQGINHFSNDLISSLTFSNSGRIIRFELTAVSGKESVSYETEVLLLNAVPLTHESAVPAIYYRKTD